MGVEVGGEAGLVYAGVSGGSGSTGLCAGWLSPPVPDTTIASLLAICMMGLHVMILLMVAGLGLGLVWRVWTRVPSDASARRMAYALA